MAEWLKALIWIMPPLGAAIILLLLWRLEFSLDKINKGTK